MPAGVIIVDAPSGKLIMGNGQVAQIWRHEFSPSINLEEFKAGRGFHPDGRPYQSQEWPLARSIRAGEMVTNEEIEIRRGDDTRGRGSARVRAGRTPEVRLADVYRFVVRRSSATPFGYAIDGDDTHDSKSDHARQIRVARRHHALPAVMDGSTRGSRGRAGGTRGSVPCTPDPRSSRTSS